MNAITLPLVIAGIMFGPSPPAFKCWSPFPLWAAGSKHAFGSNLSIRSCNRLKAPVAKILAVIIIIVTGSHSGIWRPPPVAFEG